MVYSNLWYSFQYLWCCSNPLMVSQTSLRKIKIQFKSRQQAKIIIQSFCKMWFWKNHITHFPLELWSGSGTKCCYKSKKCALFVNMRFFLKLLTRRRHALTRRLFLDCPIRFSIEIQPEIWWFIGIFDYCLEAWFEPRFEVLYQLFFGLRLVAARVRGL